MKAVIQRVSSASVKVDGREIGAIGRGILTLLAIEKGDTEDAIQAMVKKILEFRIFPDDAGKMNKSLLDVSGAHLLVSQFTLAADTNSGRRPSFTNAEAPDRAKALYALAIEESCKLGAETASGEFQADMKITLVNDGPVTFLLSS